MKRAVAITLKIPDNAAYTAASALRRLGVDVERVERSEIWLFDDGGDAAKMMDRVVADERIFNPNKHRATLLERVQPRAGEVWIEPLPEPEPVEGRGAVAWRLLDAGGNPLERAALQDAAERLLCNPAIERAVYR